MMRCFNCNNEIENNLKFCPKCGTKVISEDPDSIDFNNDLPILKSPLKDDFSFKTIDNSVDLQVDNNDFDKTISIETDMEKKSFMDDLKEEIDSVNNKCNNDSIVTKEHNSIIDSSIVLEENFKKRKKNLLIAFILLICLLGGSSLLLAVFNKKEKPIENDYVAELEMALEDFYDTNDSSLMNEILQEVKNNSDEIIKLQDKTNQMTSQWLDKFYLKDISKEQDFNDLINYYRTTLKKLYFVNVRVKNEEIRLLTTDKYKEFVSKIDDIDNEAKTYIQALSLYEKKSYNDAYYMFSKVDSLNRYYDIANKYLNTISSDVIDILKNDIKKIENDIDSLNNEQKLNKYTQIEDVIRKYDSIYNNLDLKNNTSYIEIFEIYQNKINEFNELNISNDDY